MSASARPRSTSTSRAKKTSWSLLWQDSFRTMIRERGGPTAIGQLYAAFDVVEHIIKSDEFQGCIFVNVAMEFPLPHEPAHVLAAKNKRAIEEIFYGLAVEAQAADPSALAQELCLIMEGAYVTWVVTGNKNTIDIARRIAKLVIASNCSDSLAAIGLERYDAE